MNPAADMRGRSRTCVPFTTRRGVRRAIGRLALVAACALSSTACERKPSWYSATRELYFGIPVTVSFSPPHDALAARAWESLERIDEVFNVHRADSEAGRLNAELARAAPPEGVSVSADIKEALGLSSDAHRLTGGAFDVTVKPLIDLWRAAAEAKTPPEDSEIAKALAHSGATKLRMEGDRVIAAGPGLSLDFGGIVKGMAVDRAVSILREGGARSGLVQVGGETACWGVSRRGRPHVIGVRDPLSPLDAGALWAAIADPGTGLSCATSGNYFSPIVIAGKPYYHIVDPRTGSPVDTRTLSVTLAFRQTGKNGLADALSTAGAVIGPERAVELAGKLGAEALVIYIDAEGGEPKQAKTPGWDALVPE